MLLVFCWLHLQVENHLYCWMWSHGMMRPTWKSLKKQWDLLSWTDCYGVHVCYFSYHSLYLHISIFLIVFILIYFVKYMMSKFQSVEVAVFRIKILFEFWYLFINVVAKLVPVGYGIKKLQIMMTIVDDLVSVDNMVEDYLTVEPINEYVQSCDIVAFNKICK